MIKYWHYWKSSTSRVVIGCGRLECSIKAGSLVLFTLNKNEWFTQGIIACFESQLWAILQGKDTDVRFIPCLRFPSGR